MARVKRTQVTTMDPPAEAGASTPRKKNGKNGKAAADLEAAIRVRAYQLWERRGRQDGHAQADWFQAEAEVRSGDSLTS